MKINLTGHPVAGYEIAPFIGVNLPLEAAPLQAAIETAIQGLPGFAELKQGASAEVLLPGMTGAAALVLAVWHGCFGSFPKIRWSKRDASSGFFWPDDCAADLQSVRQASRTLRA